MNCILYKNVPLSFITLGELVHNDNNDQSNSYYAPLLYMDNNLEDIKIKTISLKLTNIFIKNNQQFIEVEFLPSTNDFYKFISNIDDIIVKNFVDNSENLVGTQLNYDTVNTLYVKSIKLPKELSTLPFLELCVRNDCVVLDTNNNQISLDDLKKDTEVMLVIDFSKVIFFPNKYNLVINVNYIQLCNYCENDENNKNYENDNSE